MLITKVKKVLNLLKIFSFLSTLDTVWFVMFGLFTQMSCMLIANLWRHWSLKDVFQRCNKCHYLPVSSFFAPSGSLIRRIIIQTPGLLRKQFENYPIVSKFLNTCCILPLKCNSYSHYNHWSVNYKISKGAHSNLYQLLDCNWVLVMVTLLPGGVTCASHTLTSGGIIAAWLTTTVILTAKTHCCYLTH